MIKILIFPSKFQKRSLFLKRDFREDGASLLQVLKAGRKIGKQRKKLISLVQASQASQASSWMLSMNFDFRAFVVHLWQFDSTFNEEPVSKYFMWRTSCRGVSLNNFLINMFYWEFSMSGHYLYYELHFEYSTEYVPWHIPCELLWIPNNWDLLLFQISFDRTWAKWLDEGVPNSFRLSLSLFLSYTPQNCSSFVKVLLHFRCRQGVTQSNSTI